MGGERKREGEEEGDRQGGDRIEAGTGRAGMCMRAGAQKPPLPRTGSFRWGRRERAEGPRLPLGLGEETGSHWAH